MCVYHANNEHIFTVFSLLFFKQHSIGEQLCHVCTVCLYISGWKSYLLFLSCHSAPNEKQTNFGDINMLLLLKSFMHVRIWGGVINMEHIMCNNCFSENKKRKVWGSSTGRALFGKGLVIRQISSHGFTLAWNSRCAVIILIKFLHLKVSASFFFIHFPWWLFKRTVSWFCSREYFQTWQHYLLSQCKESEIIFSWVFELWGQWTEFRLWKLQVTYTCCHLRKAFLVCHYFCIWHSDHCIDVHAVLYPRLVEIWAASCHLCYSEGTLFSFLRQDDKPCENFGSKEINLVSFTE